MSALEPIFLNGDVTLIADRRWRVMDGMTSYAMGFSASMVMMEFITIIAEWLVFFLVFRSFEKTDKCFLVKGVFFVVVANVITAVIGLVALSVGV